MVSMSEWDAQEMVGEAALRLVQALAGRPPAVVVALLGGRRPPRVRLSKREERRLEKYRRAVRTVRRAGLGPLIYDQVAGVREMVRASA